ncbi:MAG: OmpA family protein [Polyangiaceae bacterium]
MSRLLVAFCTSCVALLLSSGASAEPVRAHGAAGLSKALGGHQQRELGLGATGLLGAELGVVSFLGVEFQLGTIYLSEGDPPEDSTLEPLGASSATLVGLGVRLHPFGARGVETVSPGGLWFALHGEAAFTGGVARPAADAQLGYDFSAVSGRVGVGPVFGYTHVFQPDDELRPSDARVPFVGLHLELVFGDAPKGPGDRDRDGILDPRDKCPDDPEDKDDFEDWDGCPEPDNDRDGVLDGADNCPLIPEDQDGFQDTDGCPDTDNDKDGILDVKDECPDEPEDKDDFEDEDGCPDLDNDQDGIADNEDLCPNEPETKNGYADHDGCPDSEQIRVVGDRIVLDDRVHFRTNSHIIRVVSYPLLERLAKLILEHPEYSHIEVQGHTDARGSDAFNKRLSQDRANSVMEFLVKHGVAKERMNAIGFGSERPLVDKRSEHAWFMNRRVEFKVTRERKVVQRSGGEPGSAGAKPAPAPAPVPPSDDDSKLPEDGPDDEAQAPKGGAK